MSVETVRNCTERVGGAVNALAGAPVPIQPLCAEVSALLHPRSARAAGRSRTMTLSDRSAPLPTSSQDDENHS
jgi:hypothetical protein